MFAVSHFQRGENLAELGLHRQTFSDLSTPLNLRIPEAVGIELKAVAKQENVRVADVVRYAVIHFLMERREADSARGRSNNKG